MRTKWASSLVAEILATSIFLNNKGNNLIFNFGLSMNAAVVPSELNRVILVLLTQTDGNAPIDKSGVPISTTKPVLSLMKLLWALIFTAAGIPHV